MSDHRHDFSLLVMIKRLDELLLMSLLVTVAKDFGVDEFYVTHLNALVHEFQFGSVDDLKLAFSNTARWNQNTMLLSQKQVMMWIFSYENSWFWILSTKNHRTLVYSMARISVIHNWVRQSLRERKHSPQDWHLENSSSDFNPSPNRMRPRTLKLTE